MAQGRVYRRGVPGSSQTSPIAINNLGDIIGTTSVDMRTPNFLYQKKPTAKARRATIEELSLPVEAILIGLNDEQSFVGQFSLEVAGRFRQAGVLIEEGEVTTIEPETDCDEPASSAQGVNSNSVIVGWTFCATPTFGFTGYVSYDGGDNFILFDAPGAFRATIVKSVNEQSEFVGNFQDSRGVHGFVFSNGFTTIDAPGASFTVATGINRKGQIAGYYGDPVQGKILSFVATPVPVKRGRK